MRLVERAYDERDRRALINAGLHPVLARVYAARRIRSASELEDDVQRLLPPASLARCEEAAALLADAIAAKRRLLIVADYDADGATACAVGVRALRAMGAQVDYLVPNRFELGYGLTPERCRHRRGAPARPAHHRGQRHREHAGVERAPRSASRC
jgi:single-stranded-DNA-specific exonuclease